MNVLTISNSTDLAYQLGVEFNQRATAYDRDGDFVDDNYLDLKKHHLFSALIPKELGGEGWTYDEMCNFIRIIGQHCGSTALAFSMHQHLVAAAVWKYKNKGVGEAMLRKVAEDQLVLVSTGARDWLGSNGEMKRVENGYKVSATKYFASQSVSGDIAITSAPFQNDLGHWKVLHFPVSLKAKGVTIKKDWDVLGMRGTGSHGIEFKNVFIAEEAIALEREREEFHPVWNVVLTVAMPLIMSAYIGIAERARDIAIDKGKSYARNQHHMVYILGKLNNLLLSAQTQWMAMISIADDLNFAIEKDNSVDILSLKTNVADACKAVVADAMEGIGGQSFYRKFELERLFRDVQAGVFHPLPKWEQYAFTGTKLLNSN